MARDYTFDVKGLIKEIEYKPWADNVSLGEKYGISRERVRQIRIENDLPTSIDAKKQWMLDNFNLFIDGARNGKTVTNPRFVKQFPMSSKLMKIVLDENPTLKNLYESALKDWADRMANPTHKTCLICKQNKPINDYYTSKSARTRDGFDRKCKECNVRAVSKYYELRKNKPKTTPSEKYCSAVPELGKLPASEFRIMTSANTGLQPQCTPYQDFFVKFRKEQEVDDARELARLATIAYYKDYSSVTAN